MKAKCDSCGDTSVAALRLGGKIIFLCGNMIVERDGISYVHPDIIVDTFPELEHECGCGRKWKE